MKNSFPKNLKLLREENNLSQTALAAKIGVTQQCVSEWENNKIEPTLSNLWLLADVFDITVDVLIGRENF